MLLLLPIIAGMVVLVLQEFEDQFKFFCGTFLEDSCYCCAVPLLESSLSKIDDNTDETEFLDSVLIPCILIGVVEVFF